MADNEEVSSALLQASVDLSKKLNNAALELRNTKKMVANQFSTSSQKVRMVMELKGDSHSLWKSFKPKLRSQIRKPEKEGLVSRIGGLGLLDDFYRVFCVNMRDLGSPVHSKALIKGVLEEYPEFSKLQVVYRDKIPIGAGLIIHFRDTVNIPWASTLRQFNPLSPNMMLYWNFLKYAADNGYRKFDFGRSTPQEGTYKFKEQWGAEPNLLFWQYWEKNHSREPSDGVDNKRKYGSLVSVWKRFPLPIANFMGPVIRRHISL